MYLTFEQLMLLVMFVLALIDLIVNHNNDKKKITAQLSRAAVIFLTTKRKLTVIGEPLPFTV